MPIINLRKFYYPTIKEDTFVEVSDEVAEALLELKREENRIISRICYHKAYFSLDCEDGIENHAIGWAQLSPEQLMIQAEEEAEHQLLLEHLREALPILTPTQARRVHARFIDQKKVREIAEEEGISKAQASVSIRGAVKKLKKYFDKKKWKLWEN